MIPAQASESHYNIFPSLLATTTIRSQLWLRIFHKKVVLIMLKTVNLVMAKIWYSLIDGNKRSAISSS